LTAIPDSQHIFPNYGIFSEGMSLQNVSRPRRSCCNSPVKVSCDAAWLLPSGCIGRLT